MFRRKEDGSEITDGNDQNSSEGASSVSTATTTPNVSAPTVATAAAQPATAASATASPAAAAANPAFRPIAPQAAMAAARPAVQAAQPAQQQMHMQQSAAQPQQAAASAAATHAANNAGTMPSEPRMPAAAVARPAAKRVLTVGPEIQMKGEVTSCDRVIIEGTVDATMRDVHTVELAESGSLKGTAEVEDAEISGTFEGDIVVRGRLTVYASGRVRGNVTYGEIEIQRGGQVSGSVRNVAEAKQAAAAGQKKAA